MTDTRTQTLRRAARAGDPDARAAWYRARIASGEASVLDAPFRRAVELLAYVGDPAAREVVDGCPCTRDDPEGLPCWKPTGSGFTPWLRGLSAWGSQTMVRAAVAAAEVAQEDYEAGDVGNIDWSTHPNRVAIEAARAWLADPSEANHRRWVEANMRAAECDWLPTPPAQAPADEYRHLSVQAAAQALGTEGPDRVRAAIRRDISQWILS